MQYLGTTTFIVLFATLLSLMTRSTSLPVPSQQVSTDSAPSLSTSKLTPEHSQLYNFSNSSDSLAQGDSDKVEERGPGSKTSKLVKSHLDNPKYFEGDLRVPQEIIDAYYGKLNDSEVRARG